MRCSSCETLLDRYVEATLALKQMREVGRHLHACAACAEVLAEIRVVDALLATTKPAELAPNFTFAIMADVRTSPAPKRVKTPMLSILGTYLIAAWLLFSAAALALANKLPALVAWERAELQGPFQALRALAGAGTSLMPALPVVVPTVAGLVFVDLIFLACIVFFYRNVRPKLAALLARSEGP